MAQDESTIAAQLSNCRAALDRVCAGVASVGDYRWGGKQVSHAAVIAALTGRERELVRQLDELPEIVVGTSDIGAVTDLGDASAVEYVEDD